MDVIDPVERPEVVPQPVVDPLTGDDGISDTSAKVSFSLPSEINSNGPVDRFVALSYCMSEKMYIVIVIIIMNSVL